MLEIMQSDQGLLFLVKVQPKACANGILGEYAGMLKVGVTAAAEKGKANSALIGLLSKVIGVPKSSIEIIRGETSRIKTVRVVGLRKGALSAVLERSPKAGGESGL